MNHDDLLAQIDLLAQPNAGSSTNKPSFYKAIRAVVELHRPDKFGFCYCSDIPSKCPTKEAIERELK